MIKKATYLAAAAAGYVLGARAGRERYEEIKTQATKVWRDPRVQQAAGDAQDYAAQQAPVVKDKARSAADSASEKASTAAHRVGEKAGTAAGKVTGSTNDADDLEGVDLVASASDVPDPKDD
ncbi:hypothetical protein [Aeromicrobium sp. CF3.5]|uniref:hypothetical protein n=1 Tax=Aeromicrobium sp. CF3.5 TaxID=3373078 RepID=UPI003EE7EF3F